MLMARSEVRGINLESRSLRMPSQMLESSVSILDREDLRKTDGDEGLEPSEDGL